MVGALAYQMGAVPFASAADSALPPKGGSFYLNLSSEPPTLHPITSVDGYSRTVHGYVLESLMVRDPETYEFLPAIAEKMEVSKDGMTFTFTLRKGITFHDGKPLTASDVKFSFDMIFEPEYKAVHLQPYYENIEKAEVVNDYMVRFKAREKYFGNLESLAIMNIVPKHVYGDPKVSVKLNKSLVGSGPYMLESWDQGKKITLKRNDQWWGRDLPPFHKENNFEKLIFRFTKEETIVLERLKKGDIDFEDGLTPETFIKKMVGPPWDGKIQKHKVENKVPKSFSFIGWNLQNPLFKERETRRALAHLLNREELNKKFLFDMSLPATGPWYQQSDYADPIVKPIPFDPKKAGELLSQVGWADHDKDGILDRTRDGKSEKLSFTLLYASKDTEKYLTIYQEDLKKAGIQLQLKIVEWNAFLKVLDEKNFEAVTLGWGGGTVDHDPKQIWHSSSSAAGGSNFISYKNPEVDRLIEDGRKELDRAQRIKIFRKIYRTIADDAPYLFFFNSKFNLYALNSRIGQERPTYNYTVGSSYWWLKKE